MKGPPRCERCGAFVSGFASISRNDSGNATSAASDSEQKMNLNVTRSPRWRLHETASPRRRRCSRQRAHAPHATASFPHRPHVGPAGVVPLRRTWWEGRTGSSGRSSRLVPSIFSCEGTIVRRPVQEPVAVLVLDLSFDDQCLKDIVGDVLDVVPHSKLSKLGLVTFYGDEAHAWRKSREDGSNAACCVVREGFCAVPSHQWLGTRDVFAKTCAAALEAAPALRNAALVLQGVHGCRTALECALDGLRETGGRVFLVSRSAPKGLDPTTSLLCNFAHVSVDAFWLDSEGRDQPRFSRELGELCRATGGLLHYSDCVDLDQFRRDFAQCHGRLLPVSR